MALKKRSCTILLLLVGLSFNFFSCNNIAEETPVAANSMEGFVETTAFIADGVSGSIDTTGGITVSGTINSDASFVIVIDSNIVDTYEIRPEDGLSEVLADIETVKDEVFIEFGDLDTAATIVTAYTDSVMTEWFATLPPGYSFMFYTIGDFLYMSLDGLVEITMHDPELMRISGNLSFNLINVLLGGTKSIVATFEDVQY